MEPLISIVVPIFNVEQYLKKCIDSIINQTYKNIEIILVDDGSDDSSGRLCDQYAHKDCRVKVFHNTNHGVSYSRNYGLKNCSGEYLLLIDSDDYIRLDYVEKLYKAMLENDYDLVICNYKMVFPNKIYELPVNFRELSGILYNDLHILYNLTMGPIVKLYKMTIIKKHNIEWPRNISFSEDRVFNYEYLRHVKKYKYINEPMYYYCHYRVNSLSGQVGLKSFMDALFALDKEKEFLYAINAYRKDYMLTSSAIFYARCFFIIHKDDSFLGYSDRMNQIIDIVGEFRNRDGLRNSIFSYLMNKKMLKTLYCLMIIKKFIKQIL